MLSKFPNMILHFTKYSFCFIITNEICSLLRTRMLFTGISSRRCLFHGTHMWRGREVEVGWEQKGLVFSKLLKSSLLYLHVVFSTSWNLMPSNDVASYHSSGRSLTRTEASTVKALRKERSSCHNQYDFSLFSVFIKENPASLSITGPGDVSGVLDFQVGALSAIFTPPLLFYTSIPMASTFTLKIILCYHH